MKKQTYQENRKGAVLNSLMCIWVLAECVKQQYITNVDVKFTKPEINNFSRKIQESAEAIHKSLAAGPNFRIRNTAGDGAETMAGEMYRVFQHFMTMNAHEVEHYMNVIDAVKSGQQVDQGAEIIKSCITTAASILTGNESPEYLAGVVDVIKSINELLKPVSHE